MTKSVTVLFALLLVFSYLVAPITLVWGWSRWIKQGPRTWSISSTLSFIGFLFASASALFALSMIFWAFSGGFEHAHGSPDYSPNFSLFYWFVRGGVVLSILGLAFALGGVWRRGATRWLAPASAIGTLAFWLLATTWP